jgi:hypothetical protein
MKKIASALLITAALAAPTLNATNAQAQVANGTAAAIPVGTWLPPVLIFASAASLIINAAITYNTECRELTSNEAMTAAFLPVLGATYNVATSKSNKCGKAVVRAKY